jgi:hypothetical protein
VTYGETTVLCTAVGAKKPRVRMATFPHKPTMNEI